MCLVSDTARARALDGLGARHQVAAAALLAGCGPYDAEWCDSCTGEVDLSSPSRQYMARLSQPWCMHMD